MEKQRNFKAFISYRHCPLDMAVAKRVQNLIERYRIPRHLRKGEEKRLGLVFRDESELPLSSNLTDDIYEALDHAEFLIVICTPETPKSLWVAQEIDYFIRTHGRERILVVLADGTPEQSLPPALTHVYREDGSVLSMIEPLCANLVAENQQSVLKKLNLEFIRLVAAMLDVPFDALYQRRKRYLRRLTAAVIGSVAAVLVLIMGLLISWNLDVTQKNQEIARNYQLALEKESQALSLLSQQYLEAGNREAALDSALQALEGEDRPYLSAAEGALAKALNPYGNGMPDYHIALELPSTVMQMHLSEDGSRLVVSDTGNCIRCYDTDTGNLLWQNQIVNSVSRYGITSVQMVDGDRFVLVNTYEKLLLLSVTDGSTLYSLELLYDAGKLQRSANVTVSGLETRFTLHYEIGNTQYYGIYDIGTFTQIELLRSDEETDIFVESFPEDGTLDAQNLTVAYSNTANTLTVQNGERTVVLENVKARAADMDLLEGYAHRLSDGSLVLVCYLEDTHYSLDPERRALSIHMLSPLGEEVYRHWQVRSVDLRHRFVGDYLALMTNNYNSTLEFSTFGTSLQLLDMADSFAQRVIDFGSIGIHDCYIRRDGQLVTVMTDGSILTPLKEEYGIVYTDLPNYNQPVRYAAAAAGDCELVCLVPEDATDRVVIIRSARNEKAIALAQSGQVVRFPSGKRFLTVEYDDQTYMLPPVVTVYDALTLEKLDQFTLAPENGYTTIFGFSQDETSLFFGSNNGYAIDLQSHQVTQLRKDVSGMEYHQPQATQRTGEPVISVIYDNTEKPEAMQLYQNLVKTGSFTFPCQESDYIYPDWTNWTVGGNGLIVCSAYTDGIVNTPHETFVYSVSDRLCRRVANLSAKEGDLEIGVGNVTKTVAFANTDGMLRLYDFDKDAVVSTFPLPVSVHEVSALQFVGRDQYLLVYKHNGSVTFMDTTEGTVLGELLLDDPIDGYNELIMEDPANHRLFICTAQGNTSGYLVDMQTWEVTARIPGLAAFLPESGLLLQRDFYTGELFASPVYTCAELMAQTRELLGRENTGIS